MELAEIKMAVITMSVLLIALAFKSIVMRSFWLGAWPTFNLNCQVKWYGLELATIKRGSFYASQ